MTRGSATDEYTAGMGERIRWVRAQNNLSQAGLGAALDVSRQSISGYETERLYPSRVVIHKMCTIYDVDPAWIYYGSGESMTRLKEFPEQGSLTPTQNTLIALIEEDAEFARNLQRKMWTAGLKRGTAKVSSGSG